MTRSRFLFAALLLSLAPVAAFAQSNVFSSNIVGYANRPFLPGYALFGNPLQGNNNDNHLSSIFLYGAVPEGASVSLWNPALQQFGTASVYQSGAWSIDYTIDPGWGALLYTPLLFTNTFVGTVLTGPSWNGGEPIPPPPPLNYGPGLHLVSSLFPANGRTFQDLIGRDPVEGEYVTALDELTQNYFTTTFHNGSWNNGAPALDIAHAAFFNLGPVPVPEPGTGALVAAGAALLLRRRAGVRRGR